MSKARCKPLEHSYSNLLQGRKGKVQKMKMIIWKTTYYVRSWRRQALHWKQGRHRISWVGIFFILAPSTFNLYQATGIPVSLSLFVSNTGTCLHRYLWSTFMWGKMKYLFLRLMHNMSIVFNTCDFIPCNI